MLGAAYFFAYLRVFVRGGLARVAEAHAREHSDRRALDHIHYWALAHFVSSFPEIARKNLQYYSLRFKIK
jgi:hypothetical protein